MIQTQDYKAKLEQLSVEHAELQRQEKELWDRITRLQSHVTDRTLLIDMIPRRNRNGDTRIPKWQKQINDTRDQIAELHKQIRDLRVQQAENTLAQGLVKSSMAEAAAQKEAAAMRERRFRKIPVLT